jgi:WD40 repeat protein
VPQSILLFRGGKDKTLKVTDVCTGEAIATFVLPNEIFSITFQKNSCVAAVVCADSVTYIVDLKRNTLLARARGHFAPVNQALFCNDGDTLITASTDDNVVFTDWQSSTRLSTKRAGVCGVFAMELSPDEQTLVRYHSA